MIKLDQLNLDIEEALSANSSPSGTPGTTRKTQVSALAEFCHTRMSPIGLRIPSGGVRVGRRSVLCTFLSSMRCILVHARFFQNQFTLLWGKPGPVNYLDRCSRFLRALIPCES